MNTENHWETAAWIWSVADQLRGDFKQSQYGRVILPFTLLRRLECVLEPTKDGVLAAAKEQENKSETVREQHLLRKAEQPFFNTSPLSLGSLSGTQMSLSFRADELCGVVFRNKTDPVSLAKAR